MQIKYYQRADGKGWIVDLRVVGMGRKTVKTEELAKGLAEQYQMQAQSGELTKESATPTIYTVDEAFTQAYRLMWEHEADHRMTKLRTKHWIRDLGPRKPISEVLLLDIERVLKKERERGLQPSTLNKKRAAISGLIGWCFENKLTALNFKLKWDEVVESGHRRRITDDEEQDLYKWMVFQHPKAAFPPKPHHRWLTQLIMWTGMRPDEAISLPWKDVDLIKGTITLWAERTKTSKTRVIHCSPQAIQALTELRRLTNGKLVYAGKYRGYKEAWDKAKERMGLKYDTQFVPYAMRHTCAKRLVDAGVHPTVIKDWLGHTNLETTMIYMQDDGTALQGAAQALGNRGVPSGVPERSIVPFPEASVPQGKRQGSTG